MGRGSYAVFPGEGTAVSTFDAAPTGSDDASEPRAASAREYRFNASTKAVRPA